MIFKELQILPGTPVQLEQLDQRRRSNVTYIGYLEGESLLVSAPRLGESYTYIGADDRVRLRFYADGHAYSLQSRVREVQLTPYRIIHLDPSGAVVAATARETPRVWSDLQAKVSRGGQSLIGRVSDISVGGAKLQFSEPSLHLDELVTIVTLLPFGERFQEVEFSGQVCSEIAAKPQGGGGYSYGIRFLEYPQDSRNLLQRYVYAEMIRVGTAKI